MRLCRPGVLDDLLLPANQAQLIDILTYHVVPDELTANEVLGSMNLDTLNGATLPVALNPVTVGGAGLEATNVLARNGIIHAIDTVLMPPSPLTTLVVSNAETAQAAQVVETQDLPLAFGQAPLWFSNPAATEAFFDLGQIQRGNPVDPQSGSGAVLFLEGKDAGGLAPRARLSLGWGSIPSEVQLDLRWTMLPEGAGQGEVRLEVAMVDGSRQVIQPTSMEVQNSDTRYLFRMENAGLEVLGADIWIQNSPGAGNLEQIRLFRLPAPLLR